MYINKIKKNKRDRDIYLEAFSKRDKEYVFFFDFADQKRKSKSLYRILNRYFRIQYIIDCESDRFWGNNSIFILVLSQSRIKEQEIIDFVKKAKEKSKIICTVIIGEMQNFGQLAEYLELNEKNVLTIETKKDLKKCLLHLFDILPNCYWMYRKVIFRDLLETALIPTVCIVLILGGFTISVLKLHYGVHDASDFSWKNSIVMEEYGNSMQNLFNGGEVLPSDDGFIYSKDNWYGDGIYNLFGTYKVDFDEITMISGNNYKYLNSKDNVLYGERDGVIYEIYPDMEKNVIDSVKSQCNFVIYNNLLFYVKVNSYNEEIWVYNFDTKKANKHIDLGYDNENKAEFHGIWPVEKGIYFIIEPIYDVLTADINMQIKNSIGRGGKLSFCSRETLGNGAIFYWDYGKNELYKICTDGQALCYTNGYFCYEDSGNIFKIKEILKIEVNEVDSDEKYLGSNMEYLYTNKYQYNLKSGKKTQIYFKDVDIKATDWVNSYCISDGFLSWRQKNYNNFMLYDEHFNLIDDNFEILQSETPKDGEIFIPSEKSYGKAPYLINGSNNMSSGGKFLRYGDRIFFIGNGNKVYTYLENEQKYDRLLILADYLWIYDEKLYYICHDDDGYYINRTSLYDLEKTEEIFSNSRCSYEMFSSLIVDSGYIYTLGINKYNGDEIKTLLKIDLYSREFSIICRADSFWVKDGQVYYSYESNFYSQDRLLIEDVILSNFPGYFIKNRFYLPGDLSKQRFIFLNISIYDLINETYCLGNIKYTSYKYAVPYNDKIIALATRNTSSFSDCKTLLKCDQNMTEAKSIMEIHNEALMNAVPYTDNEYIYLLPNLPDTVLLKIYIENKKIYKFSNGRVYSITPEEMQVFWY